ncbi:MAG: hypothetical protein HQK79_22860 [Desulfobacterales bacterium]|nr:hypothetical protein [Desulfobacterales bacterium]
MSKNNQQIPTQKDFNELLKLIQQARQKAYSQINTALIDRQISECFFERTPPGNTKLSTVLRVLQPNIKRFPQKFRFQLTYSEKDESVTNCDRFKAFKHLTLKDLGKKWFAFSKIEFSAAEMLIKVKGL